MVSLIVHLNRVFRRPNVGGRESQRAYSEWEHHWGEQVVRDYLEPHGDLQGKTVLDVGCGLGGKTVAYREGGAAVAIGTDISPAHTAASRRFALERGANAVFFTGDAGRLPFQDGAFDTVVANDAMEHFSRPDVALSEMARVTRGGGSIWLFFTPHYSPLGSHLYDYIHAPWCHLLFRRGALEGAVRRVIAQRDGGEAASVDRRVAEIMRSYDEDLNHMSVRWFTRIVRRQRGVAVSDLELRPAKFGFLRPLTRVPLVRELFTGFVVCRLQRTIS